MKKIQEIKDVLISIEEDAIKFYEKENAAAGSRLRKAMQTLKSLAQDVRKEVQELKTAKKPE